MATFIEEVASNLYERYGDDISSLTLLMPSKRAVLFLSEALSRSVDHPIWEPQYMSVDELMGLVRLQNVGDIKDVQYGILEQNGQLSIILRAGARAATADDLSLEPKQSGMADRTSVG